VHETKTEICLTLTKKIMTMHRNCGVEATIPTVHHVASSSSESKEKSILAILFVMCVVFEKNFKLSLANVRLVSPTEYCSCLNIKIQGSILFVDILRNLEKNFKMSTNNLEITSYRYLLVLITCWYYSCTKRNTVLIQLIEVRNHIL